METESEKRPFAVVTGASSGIGFELARVFIENHFDLMVVAEDVGIEAAAHSLAGHGAEVEAFRADLATVEGNESLCVRLRELNRELDVLAVNAGVGVYGNFIEDNDFKEHLNLINLNVVSPVYLIKALGKKMIQRGEGKILITSSIASQAPGTFMATYNASKAFLESFGSAVREELRDTGVTLTTLLPGPTNTEFFTRAGMENTRLGRGKKDDPADVARDGFDAMMSGEEHVVGGSFKNKVEEILFKVLPDNVKARMHRKQTETLSPKHH